MNDFADFNQYRVGAWVDRGVWEAFETLVEETVEIASVLAERVSGGVGRVAAVSGILAAGLMTQPTAWQPYSDILAQNREAPYFYGVSSHSFEAHLDKLETRFNRVLASLSQSGSQQLDADLLELAKEARARA